MKNIKKILPNFKIEKSSGNINVFGVDEAGRGPLAGPVVACCVFIRPGQYHIIESLHVDDSKRLSIIKRSEINDYLVKNIKYRIEVVDSSIIDEINILNATKLAMKKAYFGLIEGDSLESGRVLVDGNVNPFDTEIDCDTVIKGDQKSISIACASIIAKVARDDIMNQISKDYPCYNWNDNNGYPTLKHIKAIEKYGVTCYHRKSYAPIKYGKFKENDKKN